MVKRLSYDDFVQIYSKVPRLCVDLIVLVDGDAVVLTRRTDPPAIGLWHLPGGTVMKGERLLDTVYRIASEELQILPHDIRDIPKMVGVIEYDFTDEGYDGFPIGIAYLLRVKRSPKIGRSASALKTFVSLPDDMIVEQADFVRNCIKSKTF